MAGISRLTDIWVGICCCHTDPTCIPMIGFIISGSSNAKSENLGVGRVGDITIGTCGHTGSVVSGSVTNLTNGAGKSTVGSTIAGCNQGTMVTGSSTHLTG
jgi:hypothetical protein